MSEELNNEELKRVTSALDALSNNNAQATNKEWNTIMEESNKETKRHANKTKMFAIAAGLLVVVAISGAAIAVVNSGDSKEVRTVDKKPKKTVETSTTTTIPLTEEEKLELGAYTVTNVSNNPKVLDGENLVIDLGKGVDNFGSLNPSAGHLSYDSQYEQCEGAADVNNQLSSTTLDIANKQTEFVNAEFRTYSPHGTKYAEIRTNCRGESVLAITDIKTKETRLIKPEYGQIEETGDDSNYDGQNDRIKSRVQIVNIVWVDEDRFIFAKQNSYILENNRTFSDGEIQFSLANLKKNISLTNSTPLPGYDIGSDISSTTITDTITENGKTYVVSNPATYSIAENEKIEVRDLETGNLVWSKNIAPNTTPSKMTFGKNSNIVYGSLDGIDVDRRGFGYNNATGTLITKTCELLMSKN